MSNNIKCQYAGSIPIASHNDFGNNKDIHEQEGKPEEINQDGLQSKVFRNIDSRNYLKSSQGNVFENEKLSKTGDPSEDHSIAQTGFARDSWESLAYAPARRSDQY